ncbi:hypothetical protein GCM10010329_53480 [Streptomyces spiroverticillatus]|uniref:Uncharacterized protein n=1 Tax=Streptomyces finlayi TaxID=67296 RepID=A0A918X242_9ACTN|nr:hypothetical protein [Streptomyces finlayi]GHA23382.1 hypothetical protein GCM10010329_53480 [Streptomyces spiroverticillatus]GHD04789.1 hypothetical protein GCM10010334_54410 [Streptomyces finlayi]
MDTNADQQPSRPVAVNLSYASGQLAKALATAGTHPDAATRTRAAARGERWRAVLSGIAEGRLSIGSRTPVRGLPAWVTPEVVRGGFATGTASASGPLLPYETEAARHLGVPATRGALFAHALTEPGLDALFALLDSGRYEVTVPEEAALLTLAWLVRADDVDSATDLVEVLSPYVDTLRFLPRPSAVPAGRADLVHRRTVADARGRLEARLPNTAVETQREALTVWNPFSDELLAHWLRTPDDDWYADGDALLKRYRALAAEHTLCTKHRDPKGNVGILVDALTELSARRPLDARREGLLRTAVESMVRKRGLPGSERHSALRTVQAAQASLPPHHALAHLAARRLAVLPQETGAEDTAPLVAAVSAREAEESGLPAGALLPAPVRRVVEGTLSAPLATLVGRKLVPSAEVLAELVPQLVAATTARTYEDGTLRTLAAATYRAFRNRRSLLLLNLEHQVRVDELPWVRAVSAHRNPNADAALDALRELGGTAVRAFPGTLLPNPLVRELSVLARQAELDAPLVEELAADIFMGTFSPKFLKAAQVAGELLEGTLYARYYGIDYAALRDAPGKSDRRTASDKRTRRTAPDFAALCTARAGGDSAHSWSVAANGKVIEQAQILTTHNLATLVHRVSIDPGDSWDVLALRCFATVCRLTARVEGNSWPLPTIKDAAYAWRHMLFHLSLCDPATQDRVLSELHDRSGRCPEHVSARLAPAVAGLRLVANGGEFDADGTADDGRAHRFLGWSTGGHWMLPSR